MPEEPRRVHVIVSEPWDFQTENPNPFRNGLLKVITEKYAIVDFAEQFRVGKSLHDAMVCVSQQTDTGFSAWPDQAVEPLDCALGPLSQHDRKALIESHLEPNWRFTPAFRGTLHFGWRSESS